MPGHYGMSFERGRGSSRSRSAGRGSGFSSGGSGRTRRDDTNRQRVADTPNTQSRRTAAAERSRTRDDGTRRANQQNDSSRAAAIRNIQEREENSPLRNFPSVLTGIGSALRQRMISLLEQGGTPVYDPSGRFAIGVNFQGRYTGRDRNQGNMNQGEDAQQRNREAPAPPPVEQNPPATPPAPEPARPVVEAPAPPGDSPVDTTTEEATDARRRRGRQTTIATSPRGLLTPARTRRRSLMAGLIR